MESQLLVHRMQYRCTSVRGSPMACYFIQVCISFFFSECILLNSNLSKRYIIYKEKQKADIKGKNLNFLEPKKNKS